MAALVYYYLERLICTKKDEGENPEGAVSVENIHKIEDNGWVSPQKSYKEKITRQVNDTSEERDPKQLVR